jgi:predicted transcriptional regulator
MCKVKVGESYNPYKLFVGLHIPNAIAQLTTISPGAKLCYGRLSQYAGENGEAYPAHSTLAREIGVSKRSIINYLNELEAKGFIQVINRYNDQTKEYTSNFYIFLWHKDLENSLKKTGGSCKVCTTPSENPALPPSEKSAPKENHYIRESNEERNTGEKHACGFNEEEQSYENIKEMPKHLSVPSKFTAAKKDDPIDQVINKVMHREKKLIPKSPKLNSNTMIAHFNESFKEHFSGAVSPIELQKDRSLIKKLVDHYGYDFTKEMVDWAFTNYAQFRREKKLDGVLTIGVIFGFRAYLQDKVQHRFVEDDSESAW